MQEKVLLGRKSDNLEPGYVWAPYVPMNIHPKVHTCEQKNARIKRKINKLFDLGVDVTDNFSPLRNIQSRYAHSQISKSVYQVVTVSQQA